MKKIQELESIQNQRNQYRIKTESKLQKKYQIKSDPHNKTLINS